jgi:hypothetical protein
VPRASVSFLHLDDHFHPDAGAERQLGHAQRRAGVAAGLAEDVADELRRAVDDEVLAGEAGRTSLRTR